MVRTALKRPITIVVLFTGLLLFSVMAVRTISIDIFPNLNLPVIYVIQQYGGMTAKQMEGFFSTKMQDNMRRLLSAPSCMASCNTCSMGSWYACRKTGG